jgi:hypothetical protein
MTDRTSILVDPEVKEQLDEQKGQYDTWDLLLSDAADLLAEHREPSGPENTND